MPSKRAMSKYDGHTPGPWAVAGCIGQGMSLAFEIRRESEGMTGGIHARTVAIHATTEAYDGESERYMQPAYLILAERVRRHGVTQTARELGVSRWTVHRWITGEQNMTLDQAEELAGVVGMQIRFVNRKGRGRGASAATR